MMRFIALQILLTVNNLISVTNALETAAKNDSLNLLGIIELAYFELNAFRILKADALQFCESLVHPFQTGAYLVLEALVQTDSAFFGFAELVWDHDAVVSGDFYNLSHLFKRFS